MVRILQCIRKGFKQFLLDYNDNGQTILRTQHLNLIYQPISNSK